MLVAWITNHLKNGFFIFRPGEGWEYVMTLTLMGFAVAILGPGRLEHRRPRQPPAEPLGVAGFVIALGAGGAGPPSCSSRTGDPRSPSPPTPRQLTPVGQGWRAAFEPRLANSEARARKARPRWEMACFSRPHLGEGPAVALVGDEHRVVAEAAGAPRLGGDPPLHVALGPDSRPSGNATRATVMKRPPALRPSGPTPSSSASSLATLSA